MQKDKNNPETESGPTENGGTAFSRREQAAEDAQAGRARVGTGDETESDAENRDERDSGRRSGNSSL